MSDSSVVREENGGASVSPQTAMEKLSIEATETAAASPTRYKIYTRTGDQGMSSLYTMERRAKSDAVFEALGDVDELNSALGLAREYCRLQGEAAVCGALEEVQSRLLDVGSAVATPASSASAAKLSRARFPAEGIELLERWIDTLDEELPPLSNFILPSGGLAAAALHMGRCICRRAERRVAALVAAQEVDEAVLKYLNRLSDYLFTVARVMAKRGGMPETVYKKAKDVGPKGP